MPCGPRLQRMMYVAASMLALLSTADAGIAQDRGGTLPQGAYGRTAAEGRRLDSRIAWLEGEVRAATRRGNLHYGTLVAVANALGIGNVNAPRQQILALFRTKAGEAAVLQAEITDLRAHVARLQASPTRDEAQAALARAQTAYHAGRFEEADRELAALVALRQDQSDAGRTALQSAVRARANLAALQLQANRGADILLEAMARGQRDFDAGQWALAMSAAAMLLQESDLLGNNAALVRAEQILRTEALPRAPRETEPFAWAQTRGTLGSVLGLRASRESGLDSINGVIAEFEAALTVITPERDLQNWARLQINLGGALTLASERDVEPARLNRALAAMRATLARAAGRLEPMERAGMHYNIGLALQYLAQVEGSTARLNEAIAELNMAAADVDIATNVDRWSTVQAGLCNALVLLTDQTRDPATGARAIATCRAGHDSLNGRNFRYIQGLFRVNLGNALLTVGKRPGNPAMLLEARRLLTEGRSMITREANPPGWGRGGTMLAHTEIMLYALTEDRSYWDSALIRIEEAGQTIDPGDRVQTAYLDRVRWLRDNAIRVGEAPR